MLKEEDIGVGDDCERFIDGDWYPAKVISVNLETVNIRYVDDGKEEIEIPKFGEEIRYLKFCEVETDENSTVVGDIVYDVCNDSTKRLFNRHLYFIDSSCLYGLPPVEPKRISTVLQHMKLKRSSSFNEYLSSPNLPVIQLCTKAGVLFAYVKPLTSSSPIRSHSFVNFRPLAEKCSKCSSWTTFKCSSCYTSYYCSKDCQKKDWNHHKVYCTPRQVRPLFKPVESLLPKKRLHSTTKGIKNSVEAITHAAASSHLTPLSIGDWGPAVTLGTATRSATTDRYTGRNEATDASFGRSSTIPSSSSEGGASRRLYERSAAPPSSSSSAGPPIAVPLYDVRNTNASIVNLSNAHSQYASNHESFAHYDAVPLDDLDEQSGIHGHLRQTGFTEVGSRTASKETLAEQWDYGSAYQQGTIPIAEEYRSDLHANSPTNVTSDNDPRNAGSYNYQSLTRSAHSSSNSMYTQDIISQTNSPTNIHIDEDTIIHEDFPNASTPTRHHLRSLDTHNVNILTNPFGLNPFGVNRGTNVFTEADFEDDEDGMNSIAAVAPAPAPATYRNKPLSNTMITSPAVEEIDPIVEEQVRNLSMELGLPEKSLRLALKLCSNIEQAVEWVYEHASEYDMDDQYY